MNRRRVAALAALALATMTGCASTTSGRGAVGSPTAASSTPHDFPSTPSGAGSTVAESSASSPSAPASSPSVAPAPKECAKAADCKLVKSYLVGTDRVVAVYSAPSASGGVGASVLLLAVGTTPVYWHVFDGETPAELDCTDAGPVPNCALVDYVGAHAAIGYPLVVGSSSIAIGKSVGTDTPGLHPDDLNGDHLIDLAGVQNNYKPDYASGHVQWQTWRRSADAMAFVSTGCGPLTTSAPPQPSNLQTGACDSG